MTLFPFSFLCKYNFSPPNIFSSHFPISPSIEAHKDSNRRSQFPLFIFSLRFCSYHPDFVIDLLFLCRLFFLLSSLSLLATSNCVGAKCRGFMETLVVPTLAQNDKDDEKKETKMTGGDNKPNEISTVSAPDDNELILGPNFCLFNQPDKDKGGKKPSRKKVVLERLVIPFGGEMNRKRREVQDVQMVGISILCPGRPEIELTQPFISSPKAYLFTLKEGTKYSLNFSFIVSNRLVPDLKYDNILWKAGIRVDKCTVVLGTYSPRAKPYIFKLEEETLPCGILVRGMYSARTKVFDKEGNCYMDIQYYFNISKTWPSSS